jgi:hypothetical protein
LNEFREAIQFRIESEFARMNYPAIFRSFFFRVKENVYYVRDSRKRYYSIMLLKGFRVILVEMLILILLERRVGLG